MFLKEVRDGGEKKYENVGFHAFYRKSSSNDSYRKRCGCKAVSCGVTAVPSEGALLLVFCLVHPLVLFARRLLRFVVRNCDGTRGSIRTRSEISTRYGTIAALLQREVREEAGIDERESSRRGGCGDAGR